MHNWRLLLLWLLTLASGSVAADSLLTGRVIGTATSVDYATGMASTTVNTAANAFDGNLSTFFASYDRSRTWVGLDLGEKHVVTRIGWSPRNDGNGPSRMLLGLFEGANDPTFMDAVPLHLISEPGIIGQMTYATCEVTRGFRYVRYVGPADARCNVAELAFYGHAGEGDDSHFHQVTNLPTLSFHTTDGVDPYDKEHERVSSFTFIYADGTMIQEESGTTRLRGNASMAHPKKPYRIKFSSQKHIFKGSDMRSPAKAKKWTLINNYDDKTLMRNLVAFEIARRMGCSYVPWSKPVDVIVNGEYRGCYQLTDQLTVDKNRVSITEMEVTDTEGEALTGGYLLELDGYASQETSWFTSAAGNPITIKSPDDKDITTEQAQYIRKAFGLMEAKILSSDYKDPEKGFRSSLDETSLLQYFLTEELAGNPDAFWSCYITKERGNDLFRLGPVWDFDNAFDNDYRNFPTNSLSNYLSLARGGAGNARALLIRLFSDQALCDAMTAMWDALRLSGTISAEALVAYVDSTARELQQSQRLNFMRWPILNQTIQVNPRAGGSYEVEVGWMKEYLENRVPWLDAFIHGSSVEEDTVEIASAAELAAFAARVNSGTPNLHARLTADIDFTAHHNEMIGTSGYKGDFDGGGHTIYIDLQRGEDYAALFHTLNGTVHDLTVKGTIQTSGKYAGGLVALTSNASISRCQTCVTIISDIQGDGTHGGLIGIADNGTSIEDCISASTISGTQTNCCGGMVGWASGSTTIRRCLVVNNHTVGTDGSDQLSRNSGNVIASDNFYLGTWAAGSGCGGMTRLAQAQLTSGETCYLLENCQPGSTAWRQTLWQDATPVPIPSHSTVYCKSRVHCDGTLYSGTLRQFSNLAADSRQDSHTFQDGACTYCGACSAESVPCDERGFYQIESAKMLRWFADWIEQGHVDASAVLTADIDLTDDPSLMLANGRPFRGTFDGAGHTITLAQTRSDRNAGLFGHLSGTLQDLTVRGTIRTSNQFAGMVSEILGGTLLRCQCYLDIISTVSGDGTHGGLAALLSEGTDIALLQDCIFAGSISGRSTHSCGGLVGWASVTGIISNCLMLGAMDVATDNCDIICRNNTNAILTDTYYCSDWPTAIPGDAIRTDATDMTSGALCYQLNGGRTDGRQAWFQTLGNDAFPVPDSTHGDVWLYEDAYTNEDPDAVQAPKGTTQRQEGKDTIYDLSGRRLEGRPARGFYIQPGKKHVNIR